MRYGKGVTEQANDVNDSVPWRKGRVAYPRSMDGHFWYNIRTGAVETDVDRSRMEDLMGPYPTREAAQDALAAAKARTEAWDDEDRRWNGDDD